LVKLAANNFIAAKTVKELTLNKSFTYNLLNLPATSTFATGSATFAYDAAGNKLRKASTVSGTTTYTDYIAGIQHSGTTSEPIEYIMTEEGQAVPNGTTSYNYEYFLGDNLGNTRRTFDISTGAARLVQSDDYYPFGWAVNSLVTGTKNYYLYNKKEQQPEFNEYDYGARFYDPVIARWTSVDPLAEKSRRWSNYNYVMDNPIRLIDPNGMFARIPGASVGETDEDAAGNEARWAGEEEEAAKASEQNADYHVEPDHWAEAEAASNSTTSTATENSGIATGVVNSPSPEQNTADANQGTGLGEASPASAYTMRDDFVNYETLYNEFKTGTGPEYSGFGPNHPMTLDIKDSYIVKEATLHFLANESKPMIRWDAGFGLVGAFNSGTNMTAQFVGGARISIIPSKAGFIYILDNTTDQHSYHAHLGGSTPRSGGITPEGTIYQRFMWVVPYTK
jgi:RHS repeat-associated protein